MQLAATHTRHALADVLDWRVRDSLASAGTNLQCAIHIQKGINCGQVKLQTDVPNALPRRHD